MINIQLKKCDKHDLGKLIEISRITYYDSFKNMCSKETMDKYLNDAFSRKKLSRELTHKNMEFYFLLKGKTVIGYIKLNEFTAQNDIKDEDSLELERLNIIKEFQGKGLGNFLIEKSIELASVKRKNIYGLAYGKKIGQQLNFMRKMVLKNLLSTIFIWEVSGKMIIYYGLK